MTEVGDMFDEDRMKDLLGAVESDHRQLSARRSQILEEVLAHYTSASEGAPGDVVAIMATDDDVQFRTQPSRVWVAAAAILIPVIVGLAFLSRIEPEPAAIDPAVTVAPATTELPATTAAPAITPAETPVAADPGRIEFPVGEGLITLNLPTDLVVARAAEGLIVLAESATETNPANTVALFDVGSIRIADVINELVDSDEVFALRSVTTLGGEPRMRWELSVTSQAAQARGCSTGSPCLELISGRSETSVAVGVRMVIVELIVPSGEAAVVIAPLVDSNPTVSAAADVLLASVELG